MAAITPEKCWQAVFNRDPHFDGALVYGVTSTGIYCRPSCPSRRPKKDRIVIFPRSEAAEQAGFRPCRRCRPNETGYQNGSWPWVQDLCRHIEGEDSPDGSLTLRSLAARVGINPYHLQRAFKRRLGISPRQYREACRQGRFKNLIKNKMSVTEALYEAGYGSSSRLYEDASARFGMTPATYQRGGKGMRIDYAIVDCFLGRLLVAATEKGLCTVSLAKSDEVLEQDLHREYPAAKIHRGRPELKKFITAVLQHLEGRRPHLDLPLDIRATAFQWKVYEALRSVPYGATRTYGEIAQAIGKPNALRAVARACATNPVALVIPCHRVIRKDGTLGGYRWGAKNKEALLAQERKRK